MNKRNAQLAGEVARALQELLARGLSDPRVRGLLTVTRVEVSDDRRTARAFVSVMPDEHAELTMHGLRAATGHLRRHAMQRVRSRVFPRLEFVYDAALKEQQAVLAAIARATAEREAEAAVVDPVFGADEQGRGGPA